MLLPDAKNFPLSKEETLLEFERIFDEESRIFSERWNGLDGKPLREWQNLGAGAEKIYNLALRAMCYAEVSLTPRVYTRIYNLSCGDTFESVGGHTLLMLGMLSDIIEWCGLSDNDVFCDEYSCTYFEIVAAALRHDLSEIVSGDIPDNEDENYDETQERNDEADWQEEFSSLAPGYADEFWSELHIKKILREKHDLNNKPGRLLNIVDKVSAIVMVLVLQYKGFPPIMHDGEPMSKKDRYYKSLCDDRVMPDGLIGCYAAEQWTVSFFDRDLADYDDTGYATAILIMTTLLTRGKWYNWREEEYCRD